MGSRFEGTMMAEDQNPTWKDQTEGKQSVQMPQRLLTDSVRRRPGIFNQLVP